MGRILDHFEHEFCLAENMLELENQIVTLKKGSVYVEEVY